MRLQRWQRSHHGHRDMGSSPSAGPLTAASLSNAAGGQRSRGAILWHPAGRHRHFREKMSRRSGPGRQGAHELSMQQRKRRLPVLVGMNVLRSCFPPEPASAREVPSCLQAVVREVRLQQRTTTKGVARTTSRCHIPAISRTTISDRQTETCLSPPGFTPGSTSAQWAADGANPHQQRPIQPLRPNCQPVR